MKIYSHTNKRLGALAVAAIALHATANAAVIVASGDVATGTVTGTLLAIDTPFEATAVDASDLGWVRVSGSAGNNSGTYGEFWEPNGSSQNDTNGHKFITGTVTWTFDVPDGAVIHDIYVSWGKTQGNTPGGTYSYSETTSDSTYLNQLVLPSGDLELNWTDSGSVARVGSFASLGFSPITVTGGDGFVLTTVANSVAWSDAVVIDYSAIPEPTTALLGGLGLLALLRRRR